jgi:hypothetical protein
MNVFFVTLILLGAASATAAITYLLLRLLRRTRLGNSEQFVPVEFDRIVFIKSWLLRLVRQQSSRMLLRGLIFPF